MLGENEKSHISFMLFISAAFVEPEVIEGGNVSRARNSREWGNISTNVIYRCRKSNCFRFDLDKFSVEGCTSWRNRRMQPEQSQTDKKQDRSRRRAFIHPGG